MRRLISLPPVVAALSVALLFASPAGAQPGCRTTSWVSFGADALHCPGGRCAYETSTAQASARFRLSAEPWLRAIDDQIAPGLREGDVLVAVNDLLITTADGGSELANLVPGTPARLTVRRADRLTEVELVPELRCGEPLLLVGSSLLERPEDRRRGVNDGIIATSEHELQAVASASDPEAIDFTKPFRTSGDGLDLSLGMRLRCAACARREADQRWQVEDYPTVIEVEAGGVAAEAGLRVGDRIESIAGHDLRSRRGGRLLFDPPSGDFSVGYRRDGRLAQGQINRRIIKQRIVVVEDRREVRIERGASGWDPEILGALMRGWSELRRATGDVDAQRANAVGSRRWLVDGEHWGLPSWGLLFEAPGGQFFVVNGPADQRRLRLLSRPTVAEVVAGGAAEGAGIRAGDVLMEIDGHPILGSNGTRRLFLGRPGRPVKLQVQRGDRLLQFTIRPEIDR